MPTTLSIASSSTLIPVRVDVLSDDQLLRIVDTLLIDPTCWPIPLTVPLHIAVEQNVTSLAYDILSDAEVQGMGRTVRHFTGRFEIWNAKLQEKVEAQLRPQLWKIANGQAIIPKRQSEEKKDGGYNDDDVDDDYCNHDTNDMSHLIPISIRFIQNRMVVHEDILWDPHGLVSPIEFAQSMTKELNLPEEATVSILMTMLEQIYGLPMDDSPDEAVEQDLEKDVRGAWMLDVKDKLRTDSQIVAHHRT